MPHAESVPPIPSSSSPFPPSIPDRHDVEPNHRNTFYNHIQPPVAKSMQKTFDEFYQISADQIDDFVREKNYMHKIPGQIYIYSFVRSTSLTWLPQMFSLAQVTQGLGKSS